MKRFKLTIVGLLVLLLVACRPINPPITEGLVSKKRGEDPHMSYMPIFGGNSMHFAPMPVAGEYYITITGMTESGDVVNQEFKVSKKEYDTYQLGDYIKVDPSHWRVIE